MDLGVLHLSTDLPVAADAVAWSDYDANRWMLIACAGLLLLSIREIMKLTPSMLGCIVRSRGNLEVEHSVSTARSRNTCAFVLAIPFILLADRYRLYETFFIPDWNEPLPRFACLAGTLLAYLLLRRLLHALLLGVSRHRMDSESRSAIIRGMYNYFICFAVLMLLTVSVLYAFDAGDAAVRHILWGMFALMLLLAMMREWQILRMNCSGLITFLYLCGLEIMPAAILIASGFLL